MPRRTDIWRTGIIQAPIRDIALNGLDAHDILWLPNGRPFTFLADPFGLWRDEILNVFVEQYDYRDRLGRIAVFRFDPMLRQVDRRICLQEPWHLSYPFVFEAEGSIWMLPEAHRSGGLHLYRATDFPYDWELSCTILLDGAAVDATPFFHDGLWWLFYSVANSRQTKMGTLHIAFAEKLFGPWRSHPLNPVRNDLSGARPGGTPFLIDDTIILPVQDCSATYGGAIRFLKINWLTPSAFDAEVVGSLAPRPDFAPYADGLHTLSGCGGVTLLDMKRIDTSPAGLAIDARRKIKSLLTTGRSGR